MEHINTIYEAMFYMRNSDFDMIICFGREVA
jgi:hypothetical protein